MSKRLSLLIFLGVVGLVPAVASALPVLAIDADPDTPGVQSSRDVTLGALFDVHVTVAGVESSSPLNAYELDVDYDAIQLRAVSAADGGFLVPTVGVAENDLDPPDVNFAAFTFGSAGATGDGSLVTLRFQALELGTSALTLNDVILSAPFGVEIPVGSLAGASLQVIPEPSSLALVATGLALLARRGRSRGRTRHARCA